MIKFLLFVIGVITLGMAIYIWRRLPVDAQVYFRNHALHRC